MQQRYPLKPVLDVRQKTYEQRKHLENLMNSRGLVSSSSPWRRPKPIDSSRSKVSVFRERQIRNENRILLTKLSRVSMQSSPPPRNKFTLLSQSLSNIVALNRQRKYQGINKENKSIYTRIVTASPSMPQKKQWLKYIDSQNKYRMNAMKKIKKQDFTILAESQMKTMNQSMLSSITSKTNKHIKKDSTFQLPSTLHSNQV